MGNSANNSDNLDKKKSTYFAESQKRYGAKCKTFAIKYVPNDIYMVELIEQASENYKSTQDFIKTAINEKLKRDGFL